MCAVPVVEHSKVGMAQSTTVDEARVAESIRQNEPPLSDEVRNDADIGQVPRSKENGGFRSLKRRKGRFEIGVGRKRSTDQARRSRPYAVLFGCLYRRTDDLWMSRKA